MSLDANRITSVAMGTLRDAGFKPDDVPFGDTGKSALEHIVSALASAIISEIKQHGDVSVTLDPQLAAWMSLGVPVPMDGGVALKTSLITAASNLHALGTMS